MSLFSLQQNKKAHLIKDVLHHIEKIQNIFIKYKIDEFNNGYCQLCLNKIKNVILHCDDNNYNEEIIISSSNMSRVIMECWADIDNLYDELEELHKKLKLLVESV